MHWTGLLIFFNLCANIQNVKGVEIKIISDEDSPIGSVWSSRDSGYTGEVLFSSVPFNLIHTT